MSGVLAAGVDASDPAVVAALAGLGGVLCTGGLNYILGKRKAAGTVETSEASDLWNESKAFREQLMSELNNYRTEVGGLRTEAASMRSEMAALREEAALLRAALARCQAENTTLTEESAGYRKQLVAAGLLDERRGD